MDVHSYCTWSYIGKFNTLRRACQKMIMWLKTRYVCTKTQSVLSLKQTCLVRYLSGLYWHNEGLERMTSNARVTPRILFISFPRLARWLVCWHSLTLRTPVSQIVFTGYRHYIPLILTVVLLFYLARTKHHLLQYNAGHMKIVFIVCRSTFHKTFFNVKPRVEISGTFKTITYNRGYLK